MKELIEIQTKLKVEKKKEAQGSSGRVLYKYRSAEDILEAAKGLLAAQKCILTITDDVVVVGNRFYIKATATLTNEAGESVSTSAFAREPETLQTMNPSQVTGAASSYARKYALNGLLAIDDGKDIDAIGLAGNAASTMVVSKAPANAAGEEELTNDEIFKFYAKNDIDQANTLKELTRIYNSYVVLQKDKAFLAAMTAKKTEIINSQAK